MGNTTTLGNKSKFRELLDSFGLPRLIIACFLLLLLIAAPCVGLDFPTQITNIITRFSWNAVMVLAMVPMVHSGCGLNFGLPLGIVSGLLGATLSIELGYTGFASFLMAIPVTIGAVAFKLLKLIGDGIPNGLGVPMLVGIVTSGVSGWLAVWGTLKLIRTRSFMPFVIYRVALGTLVLLLIATGVRSA